MSKRRGRIYRPTWTDKRTGERRESKTWWIDYSVGGVRQRENSKSTLKEDARSLLDQRCAEARMNGGSDLLPSELAKVTVDKLLELVEQRYEVKKNRSIQQTRVVLGHLSRHLGTMKVLSFSASDVERYIVARRRERDLKDATLRRELETLLLGFRLGQSRGWVRTVPDLKDVLPPESQPREDFFTDAELIKMLAALPPSYRPLVEIAAITGWRRSALLSRRWADVRDGWLTLDRASSKNKKPYRFPVKGRVAEILAQQERQRLVTARATGRLPESVFFDHDNGEAIRAPQLRHRWEAARVATGISHTFHGLRRTAARAMVRKGVSQRVAQELLGMETPSIFARYSIVDETVLEEAAETLFRHESGKASAEGGVL